MDTSGQPEPLPRGANEPRRTCSSRVIVSERAVTHLARLPRRTTTAPGRGATQSAATGLGARSSAWRKIAPASAMIPRDASTTACMPKHPWIWPS